MMPPPFSPCSFILNTWLFEVVSFFRHIAEAFRDIAERFCEFARLTRQFAQSAGDIAKPQSDIAQRPACTAFWQFQRKLIHNFC